MSRASWTSLLGVSIVAACAGAPPSNLVDARAAHQRAAQSPAKELAPDQLHAAETYLETAERTFEDEGNSARARDRAYIAKLKAQLAVAQAGIVQANMDYERAEDERRKAEQSARAATTSELEATRAQLESAQSANAAQSAELNAETQRRQQAEAAQQQAEAAQQQALSALESAGEVKREERGTVITLSGSVIFASGESALLPPARNKLSEVASALSNGGGDSKIVVEGHTDSTGPEEVNRELSLERAAAVRDELVANGVSPERISVEGFGETRPIAENSSQAGRANNRRVEIVIQPMT